MTDNPPSTQRAGDVPPKSDVGGSDMSCGYLIIFEGLD